MLRLLQYFLTVASHVPFNILDEYSKTGVGLGEFSLPSITGLIAFELHSNIPDITLRFVLNIPVVGIPEDRDSAILKTIISNREQFFRYLLLLLGEDSDAAFLSGIGSGNQGWLAKLLKGENLALLEDLTRTYSRHPERLSDIASLIDDLTRDSGNTVIPENFIELWRIFESAMGEKNA